MITNEPTINHYFIIFHQDSLILEENQLPQGLPETLSYRANLSPYHAIGEFAGQPIYCTEWLTEAPLLPTFKVVSVRQALQHLPTHWYAMIARAIAILKWEKNHRFCGHCGTRTKQVDHLFEMRCPLCQLIFYPRISPSVIVLIERNDEILMARGAHFAPGVFGLIAGFVEAGESLEEAVHREVAEEVGLKITHLRYIGSQPWPFPDSLVAAFRAHYASGDLLIDHNEIETAGWYRYDKLPGYPSSSVSIARRLIEQFVEEKRNAFSEHE